MRLSLRQKLLLFAVIIAILPLVVAGRTMIRIAQDELKSSANDQLVITAQQLVKEINDLYERTWLAPLVLIRNALDDPQLGVEEKISLLTLGIADIPDVVALQVTVEGASLPLVVVKDGFAARLKGAGLDPLEVVRVPASLVRTFRDSGGAEHDVEIGEDNAFVDDDDTGADALLGVLTSGFVGCQTTDTNNGRSNDLVGLPRGRGKDVGLQRVKHRGADIFLGDLARRSRDRCMRIPEEQCEQPARCYP